MSPTPRAFRLLPALLLAASAAVADAQASADEPKLAGTWTWTWKDGTGNTHRHILEVEGVGKTLAAREIFDDQAPVRVTNLKLNGQSVQFTVVRGERRADYSGKVDGPDTINGTVTTTAMGQTSEFVWKAERRKDVPK
jgi:hypothetical protein